MTTCVYDRRRHRAGADTQNTADDFTIYRSRKIEKLENGNWFMGSGHSYTIGLAKMWAESDFADDEMPDFEVYIDDPATYDFACLVISADGNRVWRIDGEMSPIEVMDDYLGVGSGSAYAIGAMDAGVHLEAAMLIAAARDPNTSGPFHYETIGEVSG